MRDFVIVTDSTGDLSPKALADGQIQVAPLNFSFGNEEYEDLPGGQALDSATSSNDCVVGRCQPQPR